MDEARFWQLIDESRARAKGDDPNDKIEDQAAILTADLSGLSPEEIIAFGIIFDKKVEVSYCWSLWGAAYIINGGCSDDGFDYFRGWLIGQGQKVFEAALADPESLVDVVDDEVEGESMLYLAYRAYETKGLGELPSNTINYGRDMGEPWEEEDLPARFPKLCEKFW